MTPLPAPAVPWMAAALDELPSSPLPADPFPVDPDTRHLGQPWQPTPDPGFQPAWARVAWHPTALVYEATLVGPGLRNFARHLNARTWETGDVCEIFVQATGVPFYLELHVTPENQRLQLRFRDDSIAAVRAGSARLEDFMVADPDWVRTETRLTPTHLNVRAILPTTRLGLPSGRLDPSIDLRTAVCRYDYRARADSPILSSTALIREPFFHRRHEWLALRLHDLQTPP